MNQKLTEVKGEIHNSTIVGDFSTSVSITLLKETRTTTQNIKKETKTGTTL